MASLRKPPTLIVLLIISIVIIFWISVSDADRSLEDSASTSGWFLLASFVVLCIYGIRKRLPFLPLGRASTWLMLHLATGCVSGFMFLDHTGYRFPTGTFEILLWSGYAVLLLSGFGGWILMRQIPQPLHDSQDTLLQARIPQELAQIRDEADQQMKRLSETGSDSSFEKVYLELIRPFIFQGPGLLPQGRSGNQYIPLLLEQQYSIRFNPANIDSNSSQEQILELVAKKARLDRQQRLHLWMRGWLLIHLPLTGAMLLIILLHVLLVISHAAEMGA
ncbi:MAG TPA: hypothetical protein EYN40_03015 [Planctomycetes bacterium]|nr:hypothetical protein [Planctomycetota bacterium]